MKSLGSKKIGMNFQSNKPVKFTFSSQGKILYKKKLDMDKLPSPIVKGLEISGVSKVQNLSSLAREKE